MYSKFQNQSKIAIEKALATAAENTMRAKTLLEKIGEEKERFNAQLAKMKSTEELEKSNREMIELKEYYAKRRAEKKARLDKINKTIRDADELLADIARDREYPKQ